MAHPHTRKDPSFRELLLAIIAFVDLCLGVITLFATLPPITVILLAGHSGPFAFNAGAIDYVRIIGTFSIAFFAVVEVLSGATYLYCSDCCRSKSVCFGFKSFVFLVLEVCEFAIPLCVVKNYTEIVDFLITAPGFYCYVLYLLKFNPLTIGLFVYQAIACIIVICSKNKKSADRKPRQTPQRRRQEKSIPLLPISVYSQPPIISQVQNGANSTAPVVFPTLHVSDLDSVAIAGSSRTCSWNYSANKLGTFSDSSSVSLYKRLRSNCIKSRVLYEDPDFPATFASLNTKNGRQIKWKRPHEINSNPKFFSGNGVNGVTRFDVKQGDLGDCWLLAAIANLTLHPTLFHRVVPVDNAEDLKDRKEYAGICHFNFCDVSGNWREVIIDDRLPTVDGQLVFMTSADADEFWSCLLEKAFAKFKGGSYGDLEGGNPGVAMHHFTGGTIENIDLQRGHKDVTLSALFQMMDSALMAGNLISAAILRIPGERDGLFGGHAYSITGVKRLLLQSRGAVMLIRIRNPWGTGDEWTGEWKDGHPLWNQVDKRTRKDLELIFEEDGEFWFPMKEFKKYFDLLEICYINSTV